MLQFIIGTPGTGKTTALIERIGSAIENEDDAKAILLVPEQFSFESERLIYRRLGPKNALRVEILSFTRLCNSIFRQFGGLAGTVVTPTARYLLMSIVVEELRETFKAYRQSANNVSFLETMIAACSELKTAGITPDRLEEFAVHCRELPLREKLQDVSALYGAYQGLLSRGYLDPEDDLIRACAALENNNFFGEYHVFVDGFTTFMAGEFELLGHVITQSLSATVAMTTAQLVDEQRGAGVYSPVQAAIRRMMRMAERSGTRVEPPQVCEIPRRYIHPALSYISKHFLQPASPESKEAHNQVLFHYAAPDLYKEVEWASVHISRLVREMGYRYCEIAVIARDTGPYRVAVETMFSRYNIPYFTDERADVEMLPLISCILGALEAVRSNFDAQAVLLLAKNPVLGMGVEEVARLENYCYIWDVRGAVWQGEFTNNPRGLADTLTEEDQALLFLLNTTREKIIRPLLALKAALAKGNGKQFAAGIFRYLQEIGAPDHLTDYGELLEQGEREAFLGQAAQLWDTVIEILEVFGTVLGNIHLSSKRLCELFRLAAGAAEVGEVPQTLDQVIVGQADRIRPGDVRAVFVIGANEGVFPRQIVSGGLFSDAERQQLIEEGLELSAPSFQQAVLEKFFALFAVTLPRERLYVSYPRSDLQGRELLPSIIISGLQSMFPAFSSIGIGSPMDRVAGMQSAFILLAEQYRQHETISAALMECIQMEGAPEKVDALNKMETAARKPLHQLLDVAATRQLFGQRLRLSPSRVERFYRCPFSYFAADGLRLRKRQKVEFNPLESGSVIHNVLQVMVQRHGGDGLALLEQSQLEKEIRQIIEEYLAQRIESMEELPTRFKYLFGRLVGTMARLLMHMGREFAQSEFTPMAFELPIRHREGVEPLQLQTVDGVPVTVEGIVDRVDIMKKGGKKYVRVVDYKSGQKDFKLYDVLHGLNLQMLLYLFTIEENGRAELQDCIPAGVLYMPVRERFISAAREDGEAKLAAEHRKQWRMSGLLLEDEESLRGMEQDIGGVFIPAKLGKKGTLDARSSIATRAELGKLSQKVRQLIGDMAASLGQGKIASCPASSPDFNTCEYCDYRTLCGFEPGDAVREIAKLDRAQVFALLDQEQD